MFPCRVFILTGHPLFAESVETLLREQPDLEVIGVGEITPQPSTQVFDAAPDVVLIVASGKEQERIVSQLFHQLSGIKVVGLNLDDNRIRIYYQQLKVGRQVEDLVEAIQQPLEWGGARPAAMRILALVQGQYGQRIVENIRAYGPRGWMVESWQPPALPAVIDDPGIYLPQETSPADLILALGESPSVAQLIPDIARRVGAQAVIAPADHAAWLPEGLMRQVQGRLKRIGVAAVFPRPFCSLTEDACSLRHQRVTYTNPWIAEFARYFGRPVFRVHCGDGEVQSLDVERDTACGCGRFVAKKLAGVPVSEASFRSGILHHHYPCLAGTAERSLGDTLLNLSGHLMRRAVEVEVAPLLSQPYLVPEEFDERREGPGPVPGGVS
jgi:hypothetical protein